MISILAWLHEKHRTHKIQLKQYQKTPGVTKVRFNVLLNTLSVISETILRVRRPNQQCHSTEGRRLVNHVEGQSHKAQLTKM